MLSALGGSMSADAGLTDGPRTLRLGLFSDCFGRSAIPFSFCIEMAAQYARWLIAAKIPHVAEQSVVGVQRKGPVKRHLPHHQGQGGCFAAFGQMRRQRLFNSPANGASGFADFTRNSPTKWGQMLWNWMRTTAFSAHRRSMLGGRAFSWRLLGTILDHLFR